MAQGEHRGVESAEGGVARGAHNPKVVSAAGGKSYPRYNKKWFRKEPFFVVVVHRPLSIDYCPSSQPSPVGRIFYVARLTVVRRAGRAHNPKVVSAAGGKSHTRYQI